MVGWREEEIKGGEAAGEGGPPPPIRDVAEGGPADIMGVVEGRGDPPGPSPL